MRNISFALTTEQVRAQTKTVTRRVGWRWLNPGTLLQPVMKGQGIPKGGTVERIGGPIRVVSVRRESLSALTYDLDYGFAEVAREGFADHPQKRFPSAFVEFFTMSHGCSAADEVTRIEFEYVEPKA